MATYKLILLNDQNVLLATFPLFEYFLDAQRGLLNHGQLGEDVLRVVQAAEAQGDEAGVYATGEAKEHQKPAREM